MRIITNEEKMKSSIELYTKYKMFAYVVLFFYTVSILYFTVAKELDMSQIVFLSGIFALFSIENIGLTVFLFISSILLIYFSNSSTTLLIVLLALVMGISTYGYSNTQLGRKPE